MQKSCIAPLFHLLLDFQRKNRFISAAFALDLTPLASHLLVELELNEYDLEELKNKLGIEAAQIRNTLKGLIEAGIVKESADNATAESKFALSNAGKKLCEKLHANAEERLRHFCDHIDVVEEAQLLGFFRTLGDGLGVAPIQRSGKAHPLRIEIRRWTRALGFIGRGIAGSKLSAPQVHILRLLRDQKEGLVISEIQKVLEVDQSTLSRNLDTLVRKDFIVKQTSAYDRRYMEVKLLSAGAQVLQNLEGQVTQKLSAALTTLPDDALQSAIKILTRFVHGDTDPQIGRYQIKEFKSEADRQAARWHLISCLALAPAPGKLPERFIAADSMNFGIYYGGKLEAVAELRKRPEGVVVANFGLAAGSKSSLTDSRALALVSAHVRKSTKDKKCFFAPADGPLQVMFERLGAKKAANGFLALEITG